MQNQNKAEWPILVASGLFTQRLDEGYRLNQLVERLEKFHGCRIIESPNYSDALALCTSRADFGAVIIDWDMPAFADGKDASYVLNTIRDNNKRVAAGFIAPGNVKPGWETFAYEAFLVCGILIFMSVPIVFYIRSKKNSAPSST